MSYELTGKLIAKFDTVQRTETFKVREFAVEKTDEIGGRTVSNFVKFQSVQDKTAIIDKAVFNPLAPMQRSFQTKAVAYKSTCCVITSNGVFGAP